MRIAFSDIERLFDEKTGRAIRVIRFLSIPSAMRHHNRMDLWRMGDTGLGIEFLKVHVGIDKHFQRQTQSFERMLIDANRDYESIGSDPSQMCTAAKEWTGIYKNFVWLCQLCGAFNNS